jgi:glutamate--cysteine ligase
MDLDPFTPVGITAQTMRFLDILLLHCLLEDSPPDTPPGARGWSRATSCAARRRGASPGCGLERRGDAVTLAEWGKEVLDACEPIAAELDATRGGAGYRGRS